LPREGGLTPNREGYWHIARGKKQPERVRKGFSYGKTWKKRVLLFKVNLTGEKEIDLCKVAQGRGSLLTGSGTSDESEPRGGGEKGVILATDGKAE